MVMRISPPPATSLVTGLNMCYGGRINDYPRISPPVISSYSQLVVGTIRDWQQEEGGGQGKQDRFIHNMSTSSCYM